MQTPDTIRTALLTRLTSYGGPWTPVALADLLIAAVSDLGLFDIDHGHVIAITEGHIPLVTVAIARALRDSQVKNRSFTDAAAAVLDIMKVFSDYGIPAADTVGIPPRQRQALTLVAQGHTYDEISSIMGLKYNTVSTHLEKARKTLGARNSLQAAVKATRMGLINPGCSPAALAA